MRKSTTWSQLIFFTVSMTPIMMEHQVYRSGISLDKTSWISNLNSINNLLLILNQIQFSHNCDLSLVYNVNIKSFHMSNQTNQESSSSMLNHSRNNQISQLAYSNMEISKANKSFFIEDQLYLHEIIEQLMKEIQLLNYASLNVLDQFKEIVSEHIAFHDAIPQKITKVGQKLIQDGLFHRMWRQAAESYYALQYFQNYYQLFLPSIKTNHSHFQNAFNQCHSEEFVPKQAEQDSNTRLTTNKTAKKLNSKIVQTSLLHSSKENEQVQYSIQQSSDRMRLTKEIQTNKRRLNAQIVCYFLGIKKFYRLTEMQIDKILQFYHSQGKQVIILQAHQPTFCQVLNKVAVDYHPKIYVAMYGFVSLSMLLRIKKQYGPIQGFVLYEELLNLPLWLNNNGFVFSTKEALA